MWRGVVWLVWCGVERGGVERNGVEEGGWRVGGGWVEVGVELSCSTRYKAAALQNIRVLVVDEALGVPDARDDQLGAAEVGDHGAVVGDENVVGVQVAVHHADAVERLQPGGDVAAPPNHVRCRHRPRAADVGEPTQHHELGEEEEQLAARADHRAEVRKDVAVLERQQPVPLARPSPPPTRGLPQASISTPGTVSGQGRTAYPPVCPPARGTRPPVRMRRPAHPPYTARGRARLS